MSPQHLHADTPSRLIAPYTGGRDEMVKKPLDTDPETPENSPMMTPDTRDQQAWHRLHLTASALVDRLQSGQLVRPDDYADLIAAVEDVDGVLFSDWWDREHQPAQWDPRFVHDGMNKWVKCGPQCSLRVVAHGQARCQCRGGQAHG